MRVLLFVEELTIGGLPNYVLELARGLSACGDDVALAYPGGEVPTHLDVSGVRLLPVSLATDALRAWAPDVIHAHLCSDQRVLDAFLSLRVPLLRSFHDYTSMCLRRGRRRFPGDRCQRALGRSCVLFGCALGAPAAGSRLPGFKNVSAKLAERSAYHRFDMAIGGSRYMCSVLRANGFHPDRVRLVPYFSRFDDQARGVVPLVPKPTGVPGRDRPLELMFSGQAVAGKGLKLLVEALADVPGDWRLTAVTAGPDLPGAVRISQRGGVDARIDFKGWLPQAQLADLYRRADLLVIPSIWDDPGPLVGLEALSMETPVLGFPVGGIPDYAQDGVTGYLADAVGVAPLTRALRRAMAHAGDLAEMGRRGRDLVARVHGRTRHLESIRALYLEAARSHPAPPGARAAVHDDVAGTLAAPAVSTLKEGRQ